MANKDIHVCVYVFLKHLQKLLKYGCERFIMWFNINSQLHTLRKMSKYYFNLDESSRKLNSQFLKQ